MKEYKIGETFYIGRKKFQVVKEGNCRGCHFGCVFNDSFCHILQSDYIGSCWGTHREDKENVIFKLVEE